MLDKRLIFTLTTGRSGTMYLTEMLKLAEGVHACHEWDDKKRLTDFVRVANHARNAHDQGREWWLDVLFPHIAENVKEPIFAMTSNVFGRGMAACLIELIDDEQAPVPDIIVLRRPTRDVALSFWWRKSIPARTPNGSIYHFHPEGNCILHLKDWQRFTDYQLVYWDTLEMEKRMQVLAQQFAARGAKVFETTTMELTGGNSFLKLAEYLDLPVDEQEWRAKRGEHYNASPPEMRAQGRPEGDIDALEAEVREAITDTRFQQVPQMPQRPKVDVVVMTQPGVGNISFDLMVRLLQTIPYNKKVRASVQPSWHNPTSSNRNLTARNFRYSDWQADFLLMIDADQSPRGDFLEWVFKGHDVVIFPTPIWKPTIKDENPIVWNLQVDDDKEWIAPRLPNPLDVEALDVRGGGTGMILINRKVIEHPAMRWPFRDVFDDDGVRTSGHDLEFCYRAKELGFSVVAAIPVYSGHYKTVDLIDVLSLLRIREAAIEDANARADELQASLLKAQAKLKAAVEKQNAAE